MPVKTWRGWLNKNENILAFVRVMQILGLPALTAVSVMGYNELSSIHTQLTAALVADAVQDVRISNLTERTTVVEMNYSDVNKYLREHASPIIQPTKQ